MIHALKTEEDFFEDVAAGNKPFEVRINDRQFQVGDFLALNEIRIGSTAKLYSDEGEEDELNEWEYTGRCILVLVTYILDDPRFVKDDYCILGIRPARIGVQAFEECFTGRAPYSCPVYGKNSFVKAGGQSDGDRA